MTKNNKELDFHSFREGRYKEIDLIIKYDKQINEIEMLLKELKDKHNYNQIKKDKTKSKSKIDYWNRKEYEYMKKKGCI